MNKKDDNNELKSRVLECFKTLVENCDFEHKLTNYVNLPDYPINGFQCNSTDKEKIQELMDLSVELVMKMENKVDELVENEVCTEDLVVISVDNGEPIRYFISRYSEPNPHKIQPLYGKYEHDFEKIAASSELGKLLLGKHVGGVITYTNDEDKNVHTIKILSCRKTEYSLKVNSHEINADVNYEKGLNKK
jgi:hypothetical protein